MAVKTLPFYKDYFKIAYPLPKIDLIAIADFAAGDHFVRSFVSPSIPSLSVSPSKSVANSWSFAISQLLSQSQSEPPCWCTEDY